MDLHSGLPYWIVRNSLLDYFHPLEDDLSTDIVIVGSGNNRRFDGTRIVSCRNRMLRD